MLGLPKSTELNKLLPKKAIYAKFQMNTAQKERFDGDISRISIVGELSPGTTGLAAGGTVGSIFVLLTALKHPDFQANTIAQISKLIDQNMLLDAVWENLIVQVSGITIEQGNTLDQQIVADEKRAKLEKEIARLEKLARAEKQPKKKFELVQRIQKMRNA